MTKFAALLFLALVMISASVIAQTEFTYQGRLSDLGQSASGSFDFEFQLWDAESGGNQLGTFSADAVEVLDGEFAVVLDFGADDFDGSGRWLALSVRPAGIGTFESLSPRQAITSTPYAIRALRADAVDFDDITNPPRSAASQCVQTDGTAGLLIGGVCLLSFNNPTVFNWQDASTSCSVSGGDLCSTAQYQTLRTNRPDLFAVNLPVWSSDFSDNDSGSKLIALRSSDDPSPAQTYAYGCCKVVSDTDSRARTQMLNNVPVTFISETQTTRWPAAAMVCHSTGADLCSKSQYVSLNDSGLFGTASARLSQDFSDNDANALSSVLGTSAVDNPSSNSQFAFACCGSKRPADESCPGTVQNNVCVGSINDSADSNFFEAARACAAEGADLCSKSQMQQLRNGGLFTVESWTQDGADNDSNRAGGLLPSQPDNPNLTNDDFGYACCY